MLEFYVEVIELSTNEIVRRIGPVSEGKSNKVAKGVMRNLNFDKYWVKTYPINAKED